MKAESSMQIGRAFLLAVAVTVCGCRGGVVETATTRYSSYQSAVIDGALKRGWLPQSLPESARDIVETHNVDTGEMWLRFQYDPNDIAEFLGSCVVVTNPKRPSAERTRKLAQWWPRMLVGADVRVPNTMRAYRCEKMPHAQSELPASVVLSPEEATAWYWVGVP